MPQAATTTVQLVAPLWPCVARCDDVLPPETAFRGSKTGKKPPEKPPEKPKRM